MLQSLQKLKGLEIQSPCIGSMARFSSAHPKNKMVKTFAVGLMLMQICSVCQGIVTSCEDVSVYLGDPANITCVFSENINQTRTGDFRIYRYDLYGSGTEKEVLVLDCYWIDEAECSSAKGYTFNGTVSNRLTVVIPRADENYQGRYECQVQPTDPTNVKQCRLTLKAGVKPTPSPDHTTSLTLTTEAASDEEEDSNAAAVVVPIIVMIIIGVVGAVVAYKYRERILTSFPFLPHRRTQEDDTSKAEGGAMHYGNTDDSTQLQDQPEPETESRPLLHNQQSASVSETDQHVIVQSGGQQHKLAKTSEDEDTFYETFQSRDEMLSSHDTVETKSGKDAASNVFDTNEETNETSSQAISRDSGGSFHQTSTKTTEYSITPASEPVADTLNHAKREETHLGNKQDVVDHDIDPVEASLQTSATFKLPIQVTGETEHNKTQTTEANSEETYPANDGEIKNTKDFPALESETFEEKEKYDAAKADAMERLKKLGHFDNVETEKDSKTDEDLTDNEDDDDDDDGGGDDNDR